jgi:hypothetical protein
MSCPRLRKCILPGARWAQFEGILHEMFSIFIGFRREADTNQGKINQVTGIRTSAGELKWVRGFFGSAQSAIGSGPAV